MTHRILSLLLIGIMILGVNAHNIILPPNGRMCFFEDVNKGDKLVVSYQVDDPENSGGNNVIDFWMSDFNRQTIYTAPKSATGEHSQNIEVSGRYWYCFSNEGFSTISKQVTFNIHGIIYVDSSNNPDPLDAEIEKLMSSVRQVKSEQEYLTVRERMHRNTAESTNSRVKWWSIFQILVLAINGLFQVYYLKRFFEVKTIV